MRARAVLMLGLALATIDRPLAAGEWSASLAMDYRGFPQAPLDHEQRQDSLSAVFQHEYNRVFESMNGSFGLELFARAAQHDSERSHVDIRKLEWIMEQPGRQWRLGMRKVFWGVTESQHLVDIINQTDWLENIDGDEKLGQPMANLALSHHWGQLDLYVLPYFRERVFPNREGRLRPVPQVAQGEVVYESSREKKHIDYAARWSRSWQGLDIGFSHFRGTSRDPRLVPSTVGEITELVPHYDLIGQTGIDMAMTTGSWLWKLEGIHREGSGPAYFASVAGVEYTDSGVLDSGADLGLLAEYSWDERGGGSPSSFQDDFMVGARLAVNDAPSTELLIFLLEDLGNGARFFNLEGSRRLGEKWQLRLEVRVFSRIPATDSLAALRQDDYVRFELARFFQNN